MKNIIDETIKLIEEEDLEELFEMANITPKRSGEYYEIYATYNGKREYPRHAARVKIRTDRGRIPIQIEPIVQVPNSIDINKYDKNVKRTLNDALKYIAKNQDVFLKHWNAEIDDGELLDILESRK